MSRPYAQHLGPLWPSASDGTGLGNAGVVVTPCTDPACPVDGCRTTSGDAVNKPSHYTQGGVECIDAIEAAVCELPGPEAFLTGQVIKYVWRWRGKGGLQDLLKAEWYLKRLIEREAAEANKKDGF